jgi:glycogen debranching enzyme
MTSRLCVLGFLAYFAPAAELTPLANFSSVNRDLEIISPCVPGRPWTVAGEHGALFGRQNGKFEAWHWPVKILSDFRIRAELADYAVPIDLNALAASIRVTPAETVITYSHSAFTVRQHMFAARSKKAALPAAVFFEIDSIRPLELTFSFTPEMLRMWPAANFGRPSGEWVKEGASGFYVLHTDNDKLSAAIAMPRTQPGILVPYQEHPQTYPLEMKLRFDPKADRGLIFPLIMTVTTADKANERLTELAEVLPQAYAETQKYYAHFFDHRLIAETPDQRVNEGLRWAEIAIDQAQVKTPQGETGMVAGYYESADSARPGYAWFFGRDTLWTTYAINSYGDYGLTRRALDFLIRKQRADGKIMHEYSQAAESVDWKATPYFYASADSTPLLLMAAWDYGRTSGDRGYLKMNWDAFKKAYEFTRKHEGNDGIYSNAEGTGWVESWPPTMPEEEIYLAALDQQANLAMARLAEAMGEPALAQQASEKAIAIAAKIEAGFYDKPQSFYAFSRNSDGTLDHTATIYPAVAWWDGKNRLMEAGPMLSRWASDEFSTDWGTRDVSDRTVFYDPISYHQGTVWPLFTGWVSLAEYRAGRPLSGYAHLMQNLNLTWAQDLGSVTELLSGEFFQPLGRSSSHQMWSSAMVVTPLLRGLFGLDWDAVTRQVRVNPQLPAEWDRAAVRNVQLGTASVDLEIERTAGKLQVRALTKTPETLCLTAGQLSNKTCDAAPLAVHTLTLPLPAVELGIPAQLPEPGERTRQLKALSGDFSERSAVFVFEAQAGASYDLPVRMNRTGISVEGGRVTAGKFHLEFPNRTEPGYVRKTVTFKW